MSINTILNIGVSGLQTAQTGLRVTSDNISNANTPGYVRKLVDQQSLSFDGRGAGVDATRVRLAIDRYLQGATMRASSEAARTAAASELYDRAQTYFGDPSGDDNFFGRLDSVFSAFAQTSSDPASAPARQQAISAVQTFFSEADRIAQGIQAVRTEADARIGSAVTKVNDLLKSIEDLNQDIARQTVAGRDSSGAQGQQALLIDQLSSMMDVRVQERPQGGLTLRTTDGTLLAGQGAATLTYTPSASGGQGGFGSLLVTSPGGPPRPLLDHLQSGELKGLVDLRDGSLADLQAQLADFTSSAAKTLNAVHNAGSGVPAPTSLTGKNTGLDLTTAISGFSGKTSVAIVDSSGRLQRRVDIDFSAGTMSVDGGVASGFTPGSFLGSLNTALSPLGSASFSGGALTLTGSAGEGVAVADDPVAPSLKAGKSFSSFFGLNDLVRSSRIADFDTGLRGTDPHGFTTGDTFTLRLASQSGAPIKDITVAVPVGGTMADLLAAMNSPATGVGLFGSFGLDGNGRMAFTPSTQPGASLTVRGDQTTRGPGGPSLSELFGLPTAAGSAAPAEWGVRTDLAADPRMLALAQVDPRVGIGVSVLAVGDAANALALSAAGDAAASGSASLNRRSADFSGAIGAAASSAQRQAEGASAVADETAQQRSNQEGVNLDEELVKLTTYQQAFNASSRLIQAAKDMYDVLIDMAG